MLCQPHPAGHRKQAYESHCVKHHRIRTGRDNNSVVSLSLLWSEFQKKLEHLVSATRTILERGLTLCNGLMDSAKDLRGELEDIQRLLRREWYEDVTEEEIRAIKSAILSGPMGIATHSGHWYNCQNGHSVCYLLQYRGLTPANP